jgi:hypothetical protein
MQKRRRVKGATALIVRDEAGTLTTRIEKMAPTTERLAHGIVRPEHGSYRAAHQVEALAIAGELGDDAVQLLPAAAWIAQVGEQAQLRQDPRQAVGEPAQAARRRLARLHDALGADALGVLLDTCVWDIPVAPSRRPLLRAALHALTAWRRIGADRS